MNCPGDELSVSPNLAIGNNYSFRSLESQHMMNFLDGFSQFILKRGIKVSDGPGRHTIAQAASDIAASKINAATPEILQAFEDGRMSISIDFGKKFYDYFAITGHYISADWKMNGVLLGFARYTDDKDAKMCSQIARHRQQI
ncbi:hypothetical protein DdX_19386 [Ditylenchus destructor]|uniref:Uncharacterized protein n=1 Tax=Ditylenchus destructor TaxID=166010 RepID=A0AAD4MJI2_9BILA|nr:hypothetical protein DdX_19386 [Ditylenchus destructor]